LILATNPEEGEYRTLGNRTHKTKGYVGC